MFAAEHLTHQNVDEYQPGADFLGTARVDPNPHHVTYVVNPLRPLPGVRDGRGPRVLAVEA